MIRYSHYNCDVSGRRLKSALTQTSHQDRMVNLEGTHIDQKRSMTSLALQAALLLIYIVSVASYQSSSSSNQRYFEPSNRRRRIVSLVATIGPSLFSPTLPSQAFLWSDSNHRPIDACLLSVQRVVYWAQIQSAQLELAIANTQSADTAATTTTIPTNAPQLYVEARLGAKAALTGRRPTSGSTMRVSTLATLQLPECLQDLAWHSSKQRRRSDDTAFRSLTEALALVVEFDGLDTVTDPSPRTSLTLAQYTPTKAAFVVRALRELVVPAGSTLLNEWNEERERVVAYIREQYPNEVPVL